MRFFKVEWTKKKGAIALLATTMVVTSFIFGGYIATGNWNPWGNKHYYQVLNANFQECHTVGGETSCSQEHNVIYNDGAYWVQKLVTRANQGFCAVSSTCSMNFIAMSANTAAPSASGAATGATNGDCGNAGSEAGTELTTNGFAAVAATTVTDLSGASGGTSQLVKTFTATATQAVAKSCIVNQAANASANRVILAAATFTSITLQNGDTIQITWTITWTWS